MGGSWDFDEDETRAGSKSESDWFGSGLDARWRIRGADLIAFRLPRIVADSNGEVNSTEVTVSILKFIIAVQAGQGDLLTRVTSFKCGHGRK